MQKSRKKILLICIVVIVILILAFSAYYLFFDIQRIHGEEVLVTSESPNKDYTVIAYLNSGDATVDYSVLATAVNDSTGEARNIYWQYHCEEALIIWEDNVTVNINGILLNVLNDTYDWRNS